MEKLDETTSKLELKITQYKKIEVALETSKETIKNLQDENQNKDKKIESLKAEVSTFADKITDISLIYADWNTETTWSDHAVTKRTIRYRDSKIFIINQSGEIKYEGTLKSFHCNPSKNEVFFIEILDPIDGQPMEAAVFELTLDKEAKKMEGTFTSYEKGDFQTNVIRFEKL